MPAKHHARRREISLSQICVTLNRLNLKSVYRLTFGYTLQNHIHLPLAKSHARHVTHDTAHDMSRTTHMTDCRDETERLPGQTDTSNLRSLTPPKPQPQRNIDAHGFRRPPPLQGHNRGGLMHMDRPPPTFGARTQRTIGAHGHGRPPPTTQGGDTDTHACVKTKTKTACGEKRCDANSKYEIPFRVVCKTWKQQYEY